MDAGALPVALPQKQPVVKVYWTSQEDEALLRAVALHSTSDWTLIAKYVNGRNPHQCRNRWVNALNPDIVWGGWTAEEDDKIVQLVEKHGTSSWALIASHLPGRIGKHCRERWHNTLSPDANRTAAGWTREEDLTLVRMHALHGNSWRRIVSELPNRSDNSAKNRWCDYLLPRVKAGQFAALVEHKAYKPPKEGVPQPPPAARKHKKAAAAAGGRPKRWQVQARDPTAPALWGAARAARLAAAAATTADAAPGAVSAPGLPRGAVGSSVAAGGGSIRAAPPMGSPCLLSPPLVSGTLAGDGSDPSPGDPTAEGLGWLGGDRSHKRRRVSLLAAGADDVACGAGGYSFSAALDEAWAQELDPTSGAHAAAGDTLAAAAAAARRLSPGFDYSGDEGDGAVGAVWQTWTGTGAAAEEAAAGVAGSASWAGTGGQMKQLADRATAGQQLAGTSQAPGRTLSSRAGISKVVGPIDTVTAAQLLQAGQGYSAWAQQAGQQQQPHQQEQHWQRLLAEAIASDDHCKVEPEELGVGSGSTFQDLFSPQLPGCLATAADAAAAAAAPAAWVPPQQQQFAAGPAHLRHQLKQEPGLGSSSLGTSSSSHSSLPNAAPSGQVAVNRGGGTSALGAAVGGISTGTGPRVAPVAALGTGLDLSGPAAIGLAFCGSPAVKLDLDDGGAIGSEEGEEAADEVQDTLGRADGDIGMDEMDCGDPLPLTYTSQQLLAAQQHMLMQQQLRQQQQQLAPNVAAAGAAPASAMEARLHEMAARAAALAVARAQTGAGAEAEVAAHQRGLAAAVAGPQAVAGATGDTMMDLLHNRPPASQQQQQKQQTLEQQMQALQQQQQQQKHPHEWRQQMQGYQQRREQQQDQQVQEWQQRPAALAAGCRPPPPSSDTDPLATPHLSPNDVAALLVWWQASIRGGGAEVGDQGGLGVLSSGVRQMLTQLADSSMDPTAATRLLMAPGGPVEQLLPQVLSSATAAVFRQRQ